MTLSIYVHWPFCVRKCNYCDLNSHVDPHYNGQDYANALLTELRHYAKIYPNHEVKTIFFGGGTPSLMKPEWIQRIISEIKFLWTDAVEEITLEANPATKECDLPGIIGAGVNRLSFGVQSFDDTTLKMLGRTHTAQEAKNMVLQAKTLCKRISIDLMYNLPRETDELIQNTLDEFVSLDLDHLSVYALTIEPNTPFGQINIQLPDEDSFCRSYNIILDKTRSAGLKQYEISNFAKPGQESQHNLVYWRYGNWLGIGPGAHGRMYKSISIENEKIPRVWLKKVQEMGFGACNQTNVEDAKKEEFLMRLRLAEGISIGTAVDLLGYDPSDKLINLVCTGDVDLAEDRFNLTSSGFLRYNGILKYLWPEF